MIVLLAIGTAISQEVDVVPSVLQSLMQTCKVEDETSILIRPSTTKKLIVESTVNVSSCLQDTFTILEQETIPEKRAFVVQIRPRQNPTVTVRMLPVVDLHYFYEPNSLSIAQRIELYLHLGVVHE